MKTMQQWLDEYGESHQNTTNKRIHWVCVPLIMFSIFGLLFCLPLGQQKTWLLNGCLLLWIPALFFYLRLSIPMFLAFIAIGAILIQLNFILFNFIEEKVTSMLFIHLSIFTLAWIFQFFGHKIEGKKPSFLKDIQFLLIGPAWLMSFIFKKINIPY